MDKQTFFERVANAQKSRKASASMPEFDEADITSSAATFGTPLEAFERNFRANHGDVFYNAAQLVEFLKSKNCKRGVADSKLDIDISFLKKEFECCEKFDRQNAPESYDFGISKAAFAIGETGALVLKDTQTSDRMITLAPWIHIAVLRRCDIVKSLSQALKNTFDTPYAVYVAGPSKTTDVEGVLVEGVHGPGIQIAFIID